MNKLVEESRSFQLLTEKKAFFGNGHTFGDSVLVYIGKQGKARTFNTLSEVLQLPGVNIFQWLPDWADGFDDTKPYSNIPSDLAEKLTKTERMIYKVLQKNREEGLHKDLVIAAALGKMPDKKMRKYLVYHVCNLRKKLTDEEITCKRGIYRLSKKSD